MATERRARRGIGSRPGIDGLRAIAVVAVVLYHAEVSWLPAGFLGVDAFFAVSGYLICSLLVAEWETRQAVDLGAFWRRRARRLLPALGAMTAVVVVAALTIAPDAAGRLRADAIAGLLGLGNVWQLASRQSYFEAWGRPPLLRHLWSLGVEAQFYLAFPFLLTAGLKRTRNRTGVLALGAAGIASASALLMALLFDPARDPSRVYYGTDTRMIGLWVGVAAALAVPPGRLSSRITATARRALDATGVVALLGLVVLMVRLDEFSPALYRGGFLLVGVLSATAVAIAAHPGSRFGDVLARQPLRWIGTRSYAIYLWHWPVFMLTRPRIDVGFGGFGLFAVRIAITAALAEASWRYVERPARTLRVRLVWQPRVALGAGLTGLLVMAGLSAVATNERPGGTTAVSTLASTSSSGEGHETPLARAAVLGPPAPAPSTTEAAAPPSTGAPESTPTPAPAPTAATAPRPVTTKAATTSSGPPAPPPGSVLAIGESVMMGAANALTSASEGRVHVDAAVGRQNAAVLDRLEEYRSSGELASMAGVVLHMGTNGPMREADFERLVQLTEGVPVVVVVNVRVPKRWEAQSNATISDGIDRHPSVRLADWHAASAEPGVVGKDGVHPTPSGAKTYARVVLDRLQPHQEPPPPTTTTTTTAPPPQEPPPSTEPPTTTTTEPAPPAP
jgi:peptidoglycan/LPS O-acetylase OafA/YrhL